MEILHNCGCGKLFTALQWSELELCGIHVLPWGQILEYRNCTCGSTLSVELAHGDASKSTPA